MSVSAPYYGLSGCLLVLPILDYQGVCYCSLYWIIRVSVSAPYIGLSGCLLVLLYWIIRVSVSAPYIGLTNGG